jgi:hypothetical protein
MEMIIGFLAGVFLNYWALSIILLCGCVFELDNKSGWTLAFGIGATFIITKLINIPNIYWLYFTIAYIPLGLIWSIYRYKRYASKEVEKFKEANVTIDKRMIEYRYNDILEKIKPSKNADKISLWVLIWPFSFVSHFCDDLFNFIKTLVTKVINGVYNKVYSFVIKDLDDIKLVVEKLENK